MKIALPIWDGRVSPVFDVAHELLVADVKEQTICARAIRSLTETDASTRAKEVADLGVEVLVCGAISQALEQLLLSHGVRVIPRKCGDVNEILSAQLNDRLDEPQYTMPGCQSQGSTRDDGNAGDKQSDASDWACCDQVKIRLDHSSVEQAKTIRRWVAEVESDRVGELCLQHDQIEGRVRRFNIQPQWQQSPAPCRLIQEALSYCRRRGLIKLTIEAPIPSRRAMRLFACLGFQRNHRHRRGARNQTEFYLNLYRTVDEARCANEINASAGVD